MRSQRGGSHQWALDPALYGKVALREQSVVANRSIEPGSIWRAKNRFATINEIRIVDATENRRVWLVEWLSVGRQLRMSADSILSGYTLTADSSPV